MAGNNHTDSGYNNNGGDIIMIENKMDYYPVEIEDNNSLFQRNNNTLVLDNIEEEIRR